MNAIKSVSLALGMVAILLLTLANAATLQGSDGAPPHSARFPTQPVTFTHGVASGDVTTNGAILWTRASHTGTITVEVSLDPAFTTLAFWEAVSVTAATDFTAQVPAGSLAANETYTYRWQSATATSESGTFRTAPPAGMAADLHFAYSGDSDGTPVNGDPFYNEFEALDAARLEGLDFFIYLGDIVYTDSELRSAPALTLDEYRETYKDNRDLAALPNLLAATSTYAIWDDHEVADDYDGQTVDPTRYATGRQAFLEYLPLSDTGLPADATCAGDPFFRVYHWGEAMDLFVLDERSCRSADVTDQCELFPGFPDPAPTLPGDLRVQFGLPANPPAGCLDAIADPGRTMLGPVQKQQFKDALLASTATFKFVVNELPIQQIYVLPYDRWEGYGAERAELLDFIRTNQIENVVFLTTDIHANLINEVVIDQATDPVPIAQEFVTGPIATVTLEERVLELLGPDGLELANDLLDVAGVDCRHLDAYAYGSVVVDAAEQTATITLKDDTGTPLVDQMDPAITCRKTLRPSSYAFLPVILKP